MATKEYSCVKKTKKAFEKALVSLSKEYPLNKITVKMLCEKAELSRNAFYFHYDDINNLIRSIEDSLALEAESMLDSLSAMGFPKNVYATVEGLINLFDENRDTCRMLFDKSFSESFTQRMNKLFCDFNYQYFVDYHGETKKVRFEFFYTFISSGFYGILRHWLDNPELMTKNEVIAMVYIFIKRLIVLGDPDITNTVKKK